MQRVLQRPFLVVLLGIAALAMLLPAAHAYGLRDMRVARAFLYSGVVILILTALVGIATANQRSRDPARSHLVALFGAYLVLPPVLAVPFVQALPDTTFVNAWFEMLSSFTTTGATLYDLPDRLPPSLHLWRALVGWLGGFFVLLTAIAILAPMNLGGFEVVTSGSAGRGVAGTAQITRIAEPQERLARYAMAILPPYTGLTLLLWLGLLAAGDPGLVALCHAMGTLSSSGISPDGGVQGAVSGLTGEVLVFLFFGFALARRTFPGRVLRVETTALREDPEIRMALVCAVGLPVLLFARHWIGAIESRMGEDVAAAGAALWGSLFTTLSFLTTTGYVSASWATAQGWSGLTTPGLVLMGLAMIGGGVATTAGGVKLLRVYALFRHGQRELEKLIHPSSVGGEGPAARRLRRQGAYLAWVFFMLFAMSVALVMAALALTGMAFEPAIILTVAALSTTGPLAAVAGENPLSWAELGTPAKMILAAAMVLGRLETLAVLALLAPAGWRR